MSHQLAVKLSRLLAKKEATLALAESCTGGLVSAAICALPGASKIYLGGVVCYANDAKRDLLGVSETTLKAHGAVSKEVALGMAKGARKKFRSTWAISITGIAGPSGGTSKKPVGLVYCAVVGPHFEKVQKNLFNGSRKKIQKSAAEVAVKLLMHILN